MKTKLFYLLLLFLILIGCREEKKIEIIQAKDVYFPINEVDELSRILDEPITQKEYLKFYDSVKSFFELMGEEEKENFIVDYRLMINETGTLDKIQIIKSNYPEIDKLFFELVKDFKFESAIKNGQPVKSIFPFRLNKELFSSDVQMSDVSGKETYFVKVDEMPEPIGGMKSIQEKIVYPELAKRAGIEGRVFIMAFIDETGNVADAKVIKGVGHGLDEAALEAVKQAKFIPGKQKGEPKKVQIAIPIVFKLQ
jgi:TonB family protein